jgi:hypothetical protein
MKAILFSYLSIINLIIGSGMGEKDRLIMYYDTEFKTTYEVPEMFYGVYEGRKSGYLKLNVDGTGEYKYDIFGLAPASCERQPIQFKWGFILNEKGELIKNKRDYGFSYPILLESTGSNSFQGCRKAVMKDFILQRGDILHVSSSDDWAKPID